MLLLIRTPPYRTKKKLCPCLLLPLTPTLLTLFTPFTLFTIPLTRNAPLYPYPYHTLFTLFTKKKEPFLPLTRTLFTPFTLFTIPLTRNAPLYPYPYHTLFTLFTKKKEPFLPLTRTLFTPSNKGKGISLVILFTIEKQRGNPFAFVRRGKEGKKVSPLPLLEKVKRVRVRGIFFWYGKKG